MLVALPLPNGSPELPTDPVPLPVACASTIYSVGLVLQPHDVSLFESVAPVDRTKVIHDGDAPELLSHQKHHVGSEDTKPQTIAESGCKHNSPTPHRRSTAPLHSRMRRGSSSWRCRSSPSGSWGRTYMWRYRGRSAGSLRGRRWRLVYCEDVRDRKWGLGENVRKGDRTRVASDKAAYLACGSLAQFLV